MNHDDVDRTPPTPSTMRSTGRSGQAPEAAATLTADDLELLDALAEGWRRRDPVPEHLSERVLFALQLEDLEVEVARLSSELLEPLGARSDDEARTVTFSADQLTVMITLSRAAGSTRLDGWVAERGGQEVHLRAPAGERATRTDEDGRFVFDDVSAGMVQLVFPTQAGLTRTVVTPAIQV